MNAYLGDLSIQNQIEAFGKNHSYTSLNPVFDGSSPEDSFSEIPYEKGFQLLHYIDGILGEDNMQEMLWQYIFENQEKTVTSTKFKRKYENFVMYNYKDEHEAKDLLGKIDWNTWFTKPGPAPVTTDFNTKSIGEAQILAE